MEKKAGQGPRAMHMHRAQKLKATNGDVAFKFVLVMMLQLTVAIMDPLWSIWNEYKGPRLLMQLFPEAVKIMPTLRHLLLCRKKGIQRVDLSSRHAPNDTELCELLTSPPGAISYVVFAASSYLDIPGSAPAISRTTDLCNPGCPDDIRALCCLGRPLQLLLPEQYQQPRTGTRPNCHIQSSPLRYRIASRCAIPLSRVVLLEPLMYSSDTSTLNFTRTRAELQYNFLPVPRQNTRLFVHRYPAEPSPKARPYLFCFTSPSAYNQGTSCSLLLGILKASPLLFDTGDYQARVKLEIFQSRDWLPLYFVERFHRWWPWLLRDRKGYPLKITAKTNSQPLDRLASGVLRGVADYLSESSASADRNLRVVVPGLELINPSACERRVALVIVRKNQYRLTWERSLHAIKDFVAAQLFAKLHETPNHVLHYRGYWRVQ
ncbi:Uncharacterized protein HZ326_24379 [Fusarium oxysporum f. sp. albedinis]|nr:Uncharacterized protein HZ326_24379 [Fusarium oxysporum f. sp. albedinis]